MYCKGKTFGRKSSFYNVMKGEWDVHSADYFVICMANLNGHIGGYIGGFDGKSWRVWHR